MYCRFHWMAFPRLSAIDAMSLGMGSSTRLGPEMETRAASRGVARAGAVDTAVATDRMAQSNRIATAVCHGCPPTIPRLARRVEAMPVNLLAPNPDALHAVPGVKLGVAM